MNKLYSKKINQFPVNTLHNTFFLPSMEGNVVTLIISIRYAKMKKGFGSPLIYHKIYQY